MPCLMKKRCRASSFLRSKIFFHLPRERLLRCAMPDKMLCCAARYRFARCCRNAEMISLRVFSGAGRELCRVDVHISGCLPTFTLGGYSKDVAREEGRNVTHYIDSTLGIDFSSPQYAVPMPLLIGGFLSRSLGRVMHLGIRNTLAADLRCFADAR